MTKKCRQAVKVNLNGHAWREDLQAGAIAHEDGIHLEIDDDFNLEDATAVGEAELVIDCEEKISALRVICQRFLPHHMDAFDDAIARSLELTAVVRITLTELPVGKCKQQTEQ